MKLFIDSFFALIFLFLQTASSISVDDSSTRTNGLRTSNDEGNGISTTTPRLSWRLSSNSRNDSQTAYEIQVSSYYNTNGSPDMWESGKVSSSSPYASYAGRALVSRDIGWWRVRVWDANDTASSWTSITTFEIGLLNQSDWNASWIANTQYAVGTNSLPVFAKVFTIACTVTKARLYLLGLGQHAAMINGVAVTDAVLEPGYSAVDKTLFYSSYNIEGLISQGTNVIGVELGKGEYDPENALGGRYMKYTSAAQQLKLISQIEYTCSTGSVITVPSDTTWITTVSGPRIESSWYGGEEYDARKVLTDYSKASGSRSGWSQANITTAPLGKLVGASSPPLKVVQTVAATSVTQVCNCVSLQICVHFSHLRFLGWHILGI
jgi:hypothetical protein